MAISRRRLKRNLERSKAKVTKLEERIDYLEKTLKQYSDEIIKLSDELANNEHNYYQYANRITGMLAYIREAAMVVDPDADFDLKLVLGDQEETIEIRPIKD